MIEAGWRNLPKAIVFLKSLNSAKTWVFIRKSAPLHSLIHHSEKPLLFRFKIK
jgi:hypothetical protein